MKKLLIINKTRFGYLTDSYKWCQYLKDKYDITFICFDTGDDKIDLPGINVKYVSYTGNVKIRGCRFILYCLWNILLFHGKIMIVYFEHCDIFKKVFPFKKMLMDVRTLSISKAEHARNIYDAGIRNACKKFDLVSAISEGVRQKMHIDDDKCHLLPLGSDCISTDEKKYDELSMLYVGTLSGRKLENTIIGASLFHQQHPDITFSYDIIGQGKGNELAELRTLTEQLGLTEYIIFHGRIPNTKLAPYFKKCNVGVSYVPITEYYDCQPPTKTYEYALSGLYTIATATSSNRELITDVNGILIQDTPEDFCRAMNETNNKKETFDEALIRVSLNESLWPNIVKTKLEPILNLL